MAVRTPAGWVALRGDETGVLLGDRILASSPAGSLVATTIVSSTMLGRLAAARGARFAQTLTGFKWLARAGDGLVYAYEEAIGHCVDPEAVRDKDGQQLQSVPKASTYRADLTRYLDHLRAHERRSRAEARRARRRRPRPKDQAWRVRIN